MRLRPLVNDRPKPMAVFNGEPFLDMLMRYCASFGLRRFLLLSGYKSGMLRAYYRNRIFPWQIEVLSESKLCGTGGALRRARKFINSDPFLVLNGDSFCQIDIPEFIKFHLRHNALLSMVAVPRKNADTGELLLDTGERIISFEEKAKLHKNSWANAGIYLMRQDIFGLMPRKRIFSLESDVLVGLSGKACFAFRQRVPFIDFGTPRSYRSAIQLFKKIDFSRAGSR